MKTCQEITEMIERAKLVKISFSDRMSIFMHTIICKHCRAYLKDSKALDRMLAKRFDNFGKYSFSEEEKETMKQNVG